MKISAEELNERTKDLTTWDELKKVYIEIGAINLDDIERDKVFLKMEAELIDKHERGEISDLEFNRASIELDHEHTRLCIRSTNEECPPSYETVQKCDWDFWLDELDEIISARNKGKISNETYWQRCFELDKKYFFADEDDRHLYFNA